MKKSKILYLPLFVALHLLFVSIAYSQKNDKIIQSKQAIPNRYIVVLEDNNDLIGNFPNNPIGDEKVRRYTRELSLLYGGEVDRQYSRAIKGYAVAMSLQQALALSRDPRVKYVEEDFFIYKDQTQTNATTGLDRIDQRNLPLDTIYNYSSTGAGVHAYVIDSGIRATHTEFNGRIGNGQDFVNDGQGTNDCDGHGTHVSGTIGGTIYGVAKNVIIHPLRIFNCEGKSTGSGSLAAIDWITANRVPNAPGVVNMSLGGGYSTTSNNAVANSIAQTGLTYVVSAGNENNDACDKSPASTPQAITVGSSRPTTDQRSSFSNYGVCVDVFAPGSSITSASFSSDTGTAVFSGTSMSAPHVSGIVARFLQNNPNATPAQVENSIINSATNGVISDPGIGSPNRLAYADVVFNNTPPTPPTPGPAPAVRIPEQGVGTPYPSEYILSGGPSVAGSNPDSIEVRINGFSHTATGEVSFLLEGPNGAKILLQSGVGFNEDANNISYTFRDDASAMLENVAIAGNSTYRPTAYDSINFPAPGPGTSYNSPGPLNGGTSTLASTFGGTNPNGVWKLYVKDENLGDRGRIDNWSVFVKSPALPTNPAGLQTDVDLDYGNTSIGVRWLANPANENIVSYNLKVNGGTPISVISPAYAWSISYYARNLSPATIYNFEVQAVSSSGATSGFSTISSATRPDKPTNLQTNVVSSSQIDISWDANPAVQSVSSYNIRINNGSTITGITSANYSATSLSPRTGYFFEVQAVSTVGTVSGWSPVAAMTLATVPSVPTNISPQVVSTSQINVFWNQNPANENVTGYNLRVNGTTVTSGITFLSYAVRNLNPNTTYTFEVQAVNAQGVSGWSTPVSATTNALAPPPNPSARVVTSVVSTSQINVFWDASNSSNVTGYNLRINGTTVISNILYLSYAVRNLAPNTPYTFEVQTIGASGVSAWTTPVSSTTAPLLSPTRVSPQAVSTSQINVFWDASTSPNVTSYNLRVNGTTVTSGITYLSYAVRNLTANTSYTFEVQAVDGNGSVSGWSAPVSATTNPLAPPPSPSARVLPQVVSSTQINVFWDASTSPNITSYNLRINGTTVISNITYLSYAVRNLTANTSYTFEVQAVDGNGGISAWSAPVSATTNPLAPPPNPPARVLPQAVSTSQINVFWDASTSPNVTSYNLRVNGTTMISNITYLSYAVRNLTSNTSYTFEVQAVDGNGGISAWSAPVSATTNPLAPPPNPPARVLPQVVSSTQINVFWDASTSPNVTGYNLRINGSQVINNIGFLSYAVRNLTPDTVYNFEVQTINSEGMVSVWTTPVTARTLPVGAPEDESFLLGDEWQNSYSLINQMLRFISADFPEALP